MKTMFACWTAALVLAGTISCAMAEEATLKIGSAAPPLQVAKWVQGEPVNAFEPGKAYLVEFWATWCGPCLSSIPHVNKLHLKYKDQGLVVIGQDVWERNEAQVPTFVEQMGDKMSYRVALDDKGGNERGKMADTWMTAAGQNGIPSAFLVEKTGKIAWIGHPMTLTGELIEEVLAGTFDIDKAAVAYERRIKSEEQMNVLWNEYGALLRAGKTDAAERKLAQIEDLTPENEREGLAWYWFNLKLTSQDYAAAYRIAREASDAQLDNAQFQNALAWAIATTPGPEQRDLDLAETIAQRANEAAQGQDPTVIDTLARVVFMKGRKEEAIALQQRAVELAADSRKSLFEGTLASYQAGEIPEEN